MVAMGRLGDLTVLNFMFLVACLPIITIGPALTALYTVSFRNSRDWSGETIRPFWKAFRENFKQSTLLWLVMLAVGLLTYLDVSLFYQMAGSIQYLFVPAAILLIVLILTASILFPLLSQFSSPAKQALKNALILSMGFLPRSLIVALMHVFPVYIFFTNMPVFFEASFLWVFWYFSSCAYFGCLLLNKVFKPYRNDEEETE